ncbi:VOC family protein [Kaistia dalseonensis]|uniref:Catechol 2,3-dioxygenase-like lactoylglutathione lyase family enzyme n=1 Tax=Kaistia dalseonensis TaxID=410840 RepID=A0ABU0HDB7_9HYPH|nr:VOC family protein [Kaistia dalseonensis]MCX5497674.1 VOC family protein [Kaistia dalseonensis]MDQ0440318.1 catechol 2,3-dioxygenase-like lactoylglutathione lyase family enzyme [Kaistia dalseonensis]
MASPNLFLLYVEDTPKSVAFYTGLLGREAAVASPNFASFALDGGGALGLWARHKAVPPVAQAGTEGEIAFMVKDKAAIEALYADWTARGLAIAQEITTLDFGPTFVALDPDGHRLRVCLFDE